MVVVLCVVFFFKQKTAYEMRISDWSSDVCSSDLTKRLECVRRKGGKQREMWGPLSEPFWTKNPFIPPSAHTSQSVERVCAVCSTDILIPVLLSLLPHRY